MKKAIFQPIKLGPVTVKNRIEVAPAAPFLTNHNGTVSREFFDYTMNLAKSGAGIVTIGVSNVNPETRPMGGRCLNVGSPMVISGLNELAEGIKAYGATPSIELVHSGYMLADPYETASGTTTEEVEKIIADFANAARICVTAGFEIIFIHGGHGNVPAMFFNKKFNHRTDRFGGSFENRCRFAKELLTAVREAIGGKAAIEYRISAEEVLPDMTTFEETLDFAEEIQDYIDLLHVSRGLLEEDRLLPTINPPLYVPKAHNVPYAREFKKRLHIPVCVVSAMDLDTAETAIEAGDIDMAAMIRTILADTCCVEKARHDREEDIRPCIRCNTCISRTHSEFKEVRCAVNPVVGRETWFNLNVPARVSKKVAVIGGGPAGLEAARDCADRGHSVVLFEKNDSFGGNLNLATASAMKKDLKDYLAWSVRQCEKNENIELRLGCEATPEVLKAENPDAVIIAVGSKPIIPAFSASGTDKVLWVGDAEGSSKVGDTVVVCGAGCTGLEAALDFAKQGKKVTIVDMVPYDRIGAGGAAINLIALKNMLEEEKVEIRCEVKVEDITEEGVIISSNGEKTVLPCDTAVLSFGFKTDSAVVDSFRDITPDYFVIGDCDGPGGGNVWKAVTSAFNAAQRI